MRGICSIGLLEPKLPENVGSVLRAANCYGCSHVAIEGTRIKKSWVNHSTNTPKYHRHNPVFFGNLIDLRPHDAQIVVVELTDDAVDLTVFEHPQRAMYILGPEDGSVGQRHISQAQHVVKIPTRTCMNLAATANVLLYDRMMKMKLKYGD